MRALWIICFIRHLSCQSDTYLLLPFGADDLNYFYLFTFYPTFLSRQELTVSLSLCLMSIIHIQSHRSLPGLLAVHFGK